MIEQTIKKYLPKLNFITKPIQIKNLPLFFNTFYSFQKLLIDDQPHLVITVKDKKLGPSQFKKHAKVLKEKTGLPQIWYLQDLHYHKMNRLIENGFNFIIKNKQVYLPMVNVAINPKVTPLKTRETELNGLAIHILERQILKNDLSGKNKIELAEIFGTTQMTAGRAIERLIANELCYEEKKGVSKIITFVGKNELWEYFKTSVKSPVKKSFYTDQLINNLPFSGITALSEQTMLADDAYVTLGISKKAFKNRFSNQDFVDEEVAKAKIEVWDREPILIEKNIINPLDLYTILKDDFDERVQMELEQLLKKYEL